MILFLKRIQLCLDFIYNPGLQNKFFLIGHFIRFYCILLSVRQTGIAPGCSLKLVPRDYYLKKNNMNKKNLEKINLKAIRFSLCLKVVISAWAFYIAVASDKLNIGLLYLVVAIVFAGLFVFQLKFYQKKKTEMENNRNWSRKGVKSDFNSCWLLS